MIFPEYFATEMKRLARQTMEDELASLLAFSRAGVWAFPNDADRAEAKRRVDARSDDDVMQYLEATMPEPCPTCGHV